MWGEGTRTKRGGGEGDTFSLHLRFCPTSGGSCVPSLELGIGPVVLSFQLEQPRHFLNLVLVPHMKNSRVRYQ